MEIEKIIKLLFWLHVGFTIIYSIEILRMLFSPESPYDSQAKKNLKSEIKHSIDRVKGLAGQWYKLAYVAAFLISLIATFIKFTYIKYFYFKAFSKK
jgi:predicted MFS family arabinose efflux permease